MCLPYIALFFFITVLPWPSSQTAYTPDLHLEAAQRSLAPLNLEGNMTRGAVIALSHGGGPLPLLGDPSHRHIVESLKTRVPEILRLNTPNAPRAIVVVTAHWSETQPTISSAQKHSLLYDYYGFPPETYKLKYNAPGSPEVAQEVANALKEVGLKPVLDEERGILNTTLTTRCKFADIGMLQVGTTVFLFLCSWCILQPISQLYKSRFSPMSPLLRTYSWAALWVVCAIPTLLSSAPVSRHCTISAL